VKSLYVSDLDGTLLDKDAALSHRSRQVLTRLLNLGLRFTVATARSIVSVQAILGDLPLRLPVIEFNGAFLSDYRSGRHLLVNALLREVAAALHADIVAAGQAPIISTFDGRRDRLYFGPILNPGVQWYLDDRRKNHDPRLAEAPTTAEVLTEQVVCMTVIGRQEALTALRAVLERRVGPHIETHCQPALYSEGWHWLTVHDRRASKDQAIRCLQERCGMKDAELVVFGDHANDLKMFQIADRGLAVANATEDLKQVSHHVIGPNTGDSVALFLEQEWTH
jgi:Cof subfamily protein (haloacid dehalogenase superfamily)